MGLGGYLVPHSNAEHEAAGNAVMCTGGHHKALRTLGHGNTMNRVLPIKVTADLEKCMSRFAAFLCYRV